MIVCALSLRGDFSTELNALTITSGAVMQELNPLGILVLKTKPFCQEALQGPKKIKREKKKKRHFSEAEREARIRVRSAVVFLLCAIAATLPPPSPLENVAVQIYSCRGAAFRLLCRLKGHCHGLTCAGIQERKNTFYSNGNLQILVQF